MSNDRLFYCWACKRDVPSGEITQGGRHDEDKGGCGCYLHTEEQLAFEKGYRIGTMMPECTPGQAYKAWKEGRL